MEAAAAAPAAALLPPRPLSAWPTLHTAGHAAPGHHSSSMYPNLRTMWQVRWRVALLTCPKATTRWQCVTLPWVWQLLDKPIVDTEAMACCATLAYIWAVLIARSTVKLERGT
jgi:hypothetical protein